MLVMLPMGTTRIGAFGCAQSFFALGYILSGSVVSPALADRAGSDNLGQVISIGAMVQSIGRIVGPLILGAAFEMSPDLPYAIAGGLAAIGASLWFLTTIVGRARPAEEDALTLAKAARKAKRERSIEALQAELRELLSTRGFDLESDASVECLFKALDRALPARRIDSLKYHTLQSLAEDEVLADDSAEATESERREVKALIRRQSTLTADGL